LHNGESANQGERGKAQGNEQQNALANGHGKR
jgi:hypothetical protein